MVAFFVVKFKKAHVGSFCYVIVSFAFKHLKTKEQNKKKTYEQTRVPTKHLI